MSKQIIVTTGIYDLIKDHVRRRKVSPEEADLLTAELKRAKQVRRRELPDNVVDIYSRVTVKDHTDGTEDVFAFVPPGKAKTKHKTQSIMTPVGLALVGYAKGTRIQWPLEGREREIEILEVERF